MKQSVLLQKNKLFSVCRYLFFLAATVSVSFVIFEIGLRIFHIRPDVDFAYLPDYWADQKILGIYAPNQVVHDDLLIPYTYRINNQGLRGRDVDPQKLPGELRILVLGDSATFGFYVKDEETFPAQLETILKAKFLDRPVTVLNASSGGYTIKDEWLYLKSKGIHWAPDFVVVAFYPNDILDMMNEQSMWEGQRKNIEISWRDGWFSLSRLWKQTYLCRHILAIQLKVRLLFERSKGYDKSKTREKIFDRNFGTLRQLNDESDSDLVRNAWLKYENELGEINEFLKGRVVRLVFMAFADHSQFERSDWVEPQQNLSLICERLNIPFVDILPLLRQHGEPLKTFLVPQDTHPSAEGYAVAAKATANFIHEHSS